MDCASKKFVEYGVSILKGKKVNGSLNHGQPKMEKWLFKWWTLDRGSKSLKFPDN